MITVYGYTHGAGEGEFDVSRWPGIDAWIARLSALPGIISMQGSPE